MFSRSILLFPLLLVSFCRADEDACPAGYTEVISPPTSAVAVQIPTPTPAASAGQLSSILPTSLTVPGSAPAPDSAVSAINSQSSTVPNLVPTTAAFITSVVKQSSATTTASPSVSASTQTTSSSAPAETFIGLGTRYGGSCTEEDCWQNGACSFVDYTLPAGIDGSTCVSSDIWNNGANCGGCISVSYKGKTITVMVTNLTGGNATHLDMTPATWAKLTNGYSGGGVNDIEWEWITCPIAETTPLSIKMHGGASKYWFAATVENARLRTAKLEVSSDSGNTWTAAVLDNYNIWTLGNTLPSNTAWVRVTSVDGDQVVVENVALQSGVVTNATENY